MSYSIGRKINELRLVKKISQDDIASHLGMSRQRFSRIENGQTDVSYSMLLKIADFLAVSVNEITSAEEDKDLSILFREAESSSAVAESVDKIVDILKTFHAHEKLYYRMKEKLGEDR